MVLMEETLASDNAWSQAMAEVKSSGWRCTKRLIKLFLWLKLKNKGLWSPVRSLPSKDGDWI